MEPKFVEIDKFYKLFVEEKKCEPTAPLLAFFAKRKEGIRLSPSDAAEYIKQRQRPIINSAQNELEALKNQRQQHKQDIPEQQNNKKHSRSKTWDTETEFKNMKQRRSITERMSNFTNNNSSKNTTTATVNKSPSKTWDVAKDMKQANSVSLRERMSSLTNVTDSQKRSYKNSSQDSGNGDGNSNCTTTKTWNVASDMENSASLAQRMAELKTKRSNSQTTWDVAKDMKNTRSVGERLTSIKDREENREEKNREKVSKKAEMRQLLANVSVQNTMESVKRAGEKGSTSASWNIAEDFKNADNIQNRRESLSTMVNCRSQATSKEHKAISEDISMLTNQVSIKDKVTDMKEQTDKSNSNVKKTWDVEEEFKTSQVSIKDRLKEIAQNENNNSQTNEILNDLEMLSQLSIKDRIEGIKTGKNSDDNNNGGNKINTWNIEDDFKQFVEQKKKIQEKIDSMQEEKENINGDSGDINDKGNGNRSSTKEALTTILTTLSVKGRIEQMKRFDEEHEKKKQEEERARMQRENLSYSWGNYDENTKIEVILKQFEHLNELISGDDKSNTGDTSNESDGSDDSNGKKVVTGARVVATILASKDRYKDSIEELDFISIEKENSENISNLINNGKIILNSCIVKRNENYGIIRVTLNVTNNNQDNETQTVEIPDGMTLEPDDSDKQPMIIAHQENSRFILNRKETNDIELIGYGGNKSKSWPSNDGSSYKITMLKWKLPEILPVISQNEIEDIIRFEKSLSNDGGDSDEDINIDSAKTKSGIIQSAIWAKFATHV